MRTFQVPGRALAIVKDGRVVCAKGYGMRVAGTQPTVDTNTLFTIASNSKAFTADAEKMGRDNDGGRILGLIPCGR